MSRQERGRTNYHSGLAAEEVVARQYRESGAQIAARRWRGVSGEVDLIVRKDNELIFVEVKRARDFETALQRISQRQLSRICGAAQEFVANEPKGQLTPFRIDVACVDFAGRPQILENVTL